jgi:FkbM family methyltransferase
MWLLFLLCLPFFARADLELVPAHGGLSLDRYFLGKSNTLDYHSKPYFFFVFAPKLDAYVSGSMLGLGSWEGGLNALFEQILNENPLLRRLHVLDIGCNVGAFSLFVASKHVPVHCFEMQDEIVNLLQLSRRVNDYKHMHVYHAALWNKSGIDMHYTPLQGNFGGTSLVAQKTGAKVIATVTLPELLRNDEFLFMKLDVENAEGWVLAGMSPLIQGRKIHHFVMETRNNQAYIFDWFTQCGYVCGTYDRVPMLRERLLEHVRGVRDLTDTYCARASAPPPISCEPLQIQQTSRHRL